MREEIAKIIAKAEDFYEDADYLFKGERYGAVVNRSYYAMFTMIQGLLLSENIFAKTHQGAMSKFHELFIKTGKLPIDLGKVLNETFEKRQFGDYDVDANISEEEAKKVLKEASVFMNNVKEYLLQ